MARLARGIRRDAKRKTFYIDTKVKVADGVYKGLKVRGYQTAKEAEYDLPIQIDIFKKKWEEENNCIQSDESLQSLVNEYLTDYATTVKRSSYLNVKLVLESYLIRHFEKSGLISPKQIFTESNFINWRRSMEQRNISAHRKNLTITHVKNLLERSIDRNVLPYSCSRLRIHLKHFKDTGTKKKMRFWADAEYKQFLASFDTEDKWFVFFTLFYAVGCRVGEFKALTWNDYDPINGSLRIERQLTNRLRTGKAEFETLKRLSHMRTVILPEYANKLLSDFMKYTKIKNEHFIWFGEKATSDTTIRRVLVNHSKLAGLEVINIHGIRHSASTYMLGLAENMEDIKIISERSGHSTSEMLDTYSHALPNKQKKITDLMN